MDPALEKLLADVADGRMSVADASRRLEEYGYSAVGDYARLDVSRAARKGVPEVVYAQGKTTEQLTAVVRHFLDHADTVLCSRVSTEQAASLERISADIQFDERSRVAVVRRSGASQAPTRGVAGILAAGTGDLPAAGEAEAMGRTMGVGVVMAVDVGVAGLHRLAGPLDEMRAAGVGAIVVAAGMEGALPSVVAGLVDVPVIGLPTSTGYGMGGAGEAALLGMLQSCSPGLVVVNIDNGIGAGATAALIARRSS
jgi:NCAIR mutase (PurE)-related protein